MLELVVGTLLWYAMTGLICLPMAYDATEPPGIRMQIQSIFMWRMRR